MSVIPRLPRPAFSKTFESATAGLRPRAPFSVGPGSGALVRHIVSECAIDAGYPSFVTKNKGSFDPQTFV